MKVVKGAKLSDYTHYKLGGHVRSLTIVKSIDELLGMDEYFLKNAEVIGGGTNILASDKDYDKDVVKVAIKGCVFRDDNVEVKAGMNFTLFAIELVKRGYRGFEFAIGIPGTVGGAVVMNAGTNKFVSDVLESVEVLTRSGERKVLPVKELKYGYRNSVLQENDWIVLGATFRLDNKQEPMSQEEVVAKLNGRARSQPLSFPSAGCWFKGAWGGNDIIREVGMDGAWVGGAVSSPLFPAFILNVGASAQDVYTLARRIQKKAEESGKELPFEIKLLGEFDES